MYANWEGLKEAKARCLKVKVTFKFSCDLYAMLNY